MPLKKNVKKPETVRAFLSCSIRDRDIKLVLAAKQMLEEEYHFNCVTLGLDVSLPEHKDDAVKRMIAECECLIGIATTRFEAVDVDDRSQNLKLATVYLAQEAGAAHQLDLPLVIFRVGEVELQGVTNRNIYIEMAPNLGPSGRIMVKSQALMSTELRDLHARALERRKQKEKNILWEKVKTLTTWGTAAALAFSAMDHLSRPHCFGTFYYKKLDCKNCAVVASCKAEKVKRSSL